MGIGVQFDRQLGDRVMFRGLEVLITHLGYDYAGAIFLVEWVHNGQLEKVWARPLELEDSP